MGINYDEAKKILTGYLKIEGVKDFLDLIGRKFIFAYEYLTPESEICGTITGCDFSHTPDQRTIEGSDKNVSIWLKIYVSVPMIMNQRLSYLATQGPTWSAYRVIDGEPIRILDGEMTFI